uniref:F-box domain-containing protein n=1 Tax=Graphocephala atropunctata TaxID=36148 RepID=A0A1B6LRI3_9HEMI
MSLRTLPLEVLEILFLYVGIEDLLGVWEVVGVEGSESFWRKVCRREGFLKIPGEEESWKDVFQRSINWATGTFQKREYKFEKLKNKPLDIKDTLHGKNLLVKGKNDVLIWNLETDPEMVQTLSTDYLRVEGSKLYTHVATSSSIYSKEKSKYKKLMDLMSNSPHKFSLQYALSEDFFAVFQDNHRTIWIIDFARVDQSSVTLSQKVMPITLLLQNAVLNVLVIEMNRYVLKRFNLHSKEWLEEVVLFKGAALISYPDLHMSSDLIAGWCNVFDNRGITPLKVWNAKGELLNSLSMDFITSFGPNKKLRDPDRIFWMIVKGEYVIISTSTTSLTIWNSKDPDVCRELPKVKDLYKGQCIISSSLLVLSYSHCFKVIDFKKAKYLYEVEHQNLPVMFFRNEYFYITLSEVREKSEGISLGEECLPQSSDSSQGHSSTYDELFNPIRSVFEYTMCIYDFRGSYS